MSEFGWAHISGGLGGGPTGSIQYRARAGAVVGSAKFLYHTASDEVRITGSLAVTNTITANNYVVNNISNLYSEGSSKFGDTTGDTHEFTGSLNLLGALSASQNITASFFYGDGSKLTGLPVQNYTSGVNNRILTSVDANSIQGEGNLLFDGSKLNLTGEMSASIGVSGSSGQFGDLTSRIGNFSHLTGAGITDGTATIAGGDISNVGTLAAANVNATNLSGLVTTPAQTSITSLGTLDSLNITGDLAVDTATGRTFAVHSAADNVSIGRHDSAAKKLEIYSSTGQLRLSNTSTSWPTVDKKADITLDSAGDLILDPDRDVLVSGSLVVSGTVYAKQLITDIVSKNISIINAVGSTKFGDDSGDTHQFTGSIYGASLVSGSTFQAGNGQVLTLSASNHVSASTYYGDGSNLTNLQLPVMSYSNGANNRILTATSADGINGESNLTFDSATNVLTVTGQVTASTGLSASLVQATNASFTTIAGTLSTATQNAITSVGTLAGLTIDGGDLSVNSNSLYVFDAAHKVGIGRGDIANAKLEIFQNESNARQIRLTNRRTVGSATDVYTDMYVARNGRLYITASGGTSHLLGNLEVSGSVYAKEFVTDIVSKNIVNISATGSTKFGDDTGDTHIFTGSMFATSLSASSLQGTTLTASTHVSASTYFGDGSNLTGINAAVNTYTNAANNRIITSVDATGINGEANLTFDGTIMNVVGNITASTFVSASNVYANIGTFDTIAGTLSTATQNAITSVGTLSNLTISGDLTVDGNTLFVKASEDKAIIGRIPDGANPFTNKFEIYNYSADGKQLRLGNATAGSVYKYVDFNLLRDGNLHINPVGGETVITGALVGTAGATFKRVSKNTNYTITNTDYFVGVTAGSALKLTLPAANTLRDGQHFVVKDEGGTANTYNIEISCSSGNIIDGDGSISLTVNYSAVNIYTDGSSKFFVY